MNKLVSRALAAVLALTLGASQARPCFADDFGGEAYAPAGGVAGEAAKAVVDRVFGVKGEAADIRYHAVELSNHSPVNAGIRSALLPGWGQWFNRQPVKAAALFTVITVGAFGAFRSHARSQDAYDEYKAVGNRSDSSYDDYESRRTQSLILGGAAATLWLYSIWDAYRNAYNPLWSESPAVQIAFHQDGAGVEWRRRF